MAYLFALMFNLEVLGGLLSDAPAKVELIDLTHFVPERRFIVKNEFAIGDLLLLWTCLGVGLDTTSSTFHFDLLLDVRFLERLEIFEVAAPTKLVVARVVVFRTAVEIVKPVTRTKGRR